MRSARTIRSAAYRRINSPPEDDSVYFRMDLNWGWLGNQDNSIQHGAVVVLERKGGIHCVHEKYSIYPDGRIIGENGIGIIISKHISPTGVSALLERLYQEGWFDDYLFSAYPNNICPVCYGYLMTVSYKGLVKTVAYADDTRGPATYWMCVSDVYNIVPNFSETTWL